MNLISFSIAKTGQRGGGDGLEHDTCRQGEWTYTITCFSPSPLPFHFMSALPSSDFHKLFTLHVCIIITSFSSKSFTASCLHFHHVFSTKTTTVWHLLCHYVFHQILYSLPLSVFQQVLRRFIFCVCDRLFSPRPFLFFVKSITVRFCLATVYFFLQVLYLFTSANFQSRFHWNNTTLSTVTHIIIWQCGCVTKVASSRCALKTQSKSGSFGAPNQEFMDSGGGSRPGCLLVASALGELGLVVR